MERLQKVIAHSGITSRRKAEQLIVDGKVKVNNKVVTKLGTKVTPQDLIKVNEIPIEKEAPVYYLLNKPREVISSVYDDKGRKIVTDFLPHVSKRVYPVGRLDYHSSGIILLTNDGEFANLLMHPRYEIDKVYVVKIKGIATRIELEQLKSGISDENDLLKAIDFRVLSTDRNKQSMIIEITLREGKNRHIRRMMGKLGYPVMKIKREKYGVLTLGGLQPGKIRQLTPKEVNQMRNLALN